MQLHLSFSLGNNQPQEPLGDSNQRYTPPKYIKLVDEVLQGIDLDPTADPDRNVPANRHITESEDCLVTPWDNARTIFMNPPYSNAHPFIDRLCRHLHDTPEAVAITLTHQGLMQTQGSGDLFKKYGQAYCFPFKRINFVYPAHLEAKKGNDRDSVFVLWGTENTSHIRLFERVFERLGLILKP